MNRVFFYILIISFVATNSISGQTKQEEQSQYVTRYFDMKLLAFVPGAFEKGEQFSAGMAAVQRDSIWGYINTQGKVVIDFKYDECNSFVGKYAVAKRNGKTLLLNQNGEEFFYGDFEKMELLQANDEVVLAVQNREHVWGLINVQGEVLLNFNYSLILPRHSNKFKILEAFVKNDTLTAALEVGSNFSTQSPSDLPDSKVEIYNAKLEKLVTLSNKEKRYKLLPFRSEWLDENQQLTKLFPKKDEEIPSSMDRFDQHLIDSIQSFVFENEEGLKRLGMEGKNEIIPAQFDNITAVPAFASNLSKEDQKTLENHFRAQALQTEHLKGALYFYYLIVIKGDLQGVYSLDGKEIVPAKYGWVTVLPSIGFKVSTYDDKNGLLGFDGSVIMAPTNEYSHFGEINADFFTIHRSTQENGVYRTYQGLADKDGNIIVPANRYYSIFPLNEPVSQKYPELAEVQIQHKSTFATGIINMQGKEIVSPIYRYVSLYPEQGLAVLQDFDQKNKLYFFDFDQQRIVESIECLCYNQFLIGIAPDGILRIYEKVEP